MKALIILLILPLKLLSQDISGIWTGLIHTEGNDLLFELTINDNNEKTTGYSLTVFTIDGIENMGIKSVILKKKKGNISIEDDELIFNNYTTSPRRVKLFGSLSLNVEDSIMTLTGKFHTRTLDFRTNTNSYTGTINLQKQKNLTETKLIAQLDKLNLLNTLSFRKPRMQEKEKPPIAAIRSEKPQPDLKEEKVNVKDSVVLTTISKSSVDIQRPVNNETDSIFKKEMTAKTLQTSVTKTKTNENSTPLVSATEQKQLAASKQKKNTIDSSFKKIEIKTPIAETKSNKTSSPPAIVKESKQSTVSKENGNTIDSSSRNIQVSTAETKPNRPLVPLPLANESKQLPVSKEKGNPIDSNSKIQGKNMQPVVEVKSTISQPVSIKKEASAISNAAAAIAERKTEIIRSVFFRSDSLVLSLYDNGTIDGDTVSVVLNGVIIIAKKGLTATALRVVVPMPPGTADSLLLTMYAENLGSIPPNTGLLIIQDGDDRSEIRFESDTQKNAAIILRRRR